MKKSRHYYDPHEARENKDIKKAESALHDMDKHQSKHKSKGKRKKK